MFTAGKACELLKCSKGTRHRAQALSRLQTQLEVRPGRSGAPGMGALPSCPGDWGGWAGAPEAHGRAPRLPASREGRGVRRREASAPTPACLHLPQVQAVQTAVRPDEGLSRNPLAPQDSQQASPTPSPRHHPSCHVRPACPHQPASQPVPCRGRCVGPPERHLRPGHLGHKTYPSPSRPRSVFFRSGPRVGGAGRCQRGRGARVSGHRCRSDIFLSIDRLIINIH